MDTSTVEVGRNSHYYIEVLVRYMQALQKLVLDEGCDTIEKELSHYIMATMLLGPTMKLEIEGIVLFLSVEHMHGNTSAFISGEHLFDIDVFEHLLFLPKC